MVRKLIVVFMMLPLFALGGYPEGKDVLARIDKNMTSTNSVIVAKMIVHGRRLSRTMEFKTWSEGEDNGFTEYFSPAREKGTKMLKQGDRLWIYSPSTDRIIQISGHMLRQSVMGSDLSYEDMMEEQELALHYDAVVVGEEQIEGRDCLIVNLTAKREGVAYYKRKLWVDSERFVPVKEELFAKSGKLLKRTEMFDITNIDGRWYPKRLIFKDMLKQGKGTEFIIDKIEFNVDIPGYIFNKASLKK